MKRLQLIYLGLSTAVTLSACATSKDKSTQDYESSQSQIPLSSSGQGNNIAPRLVGRSLDRGECGLFVWTGDQDRRFILFSQSQKGSAAWAGPNGELPLTIVETSGQAFQGQYTVQNFAQVSKDKNVINPPFLTLSLRNLEEVVDSTRFKGGTLSQTSQDGLQRVIPIVGLSTCR